MGTVEEELNDYVWSNLTELKSIFSDKVYQALTKAKDKESFKETIELIIDLDSDFFDIVNREYMKNLSIEDVSKQFDILATDEVIERAEYWLENYNKEDEKYALLLNDLASFYKSRGENEKVESLSNKAIEIYQKVVELNPSDYDAYRNMGNSYSLKDEDDKAIEYYQKAIEINPKNDKAYNGMGNSYSFKDEDDKAIGYYQKAIELNPKNDNAYNGMGNSYNDKGEYDKAIEYYKKALEINPKNDTAYGNIGNSYNNKSEFDKAIEYYKMTLELNPKNDYVYDGMGNCYNYKGEYDKAIEYYQKALEINPKNDNAYNGMGDSYYYKYEEDKAIEYYKKALEINPKNDNAYNSMGNAYHKKGEDYKAIEYYQKAIELNPKNDNAFDNLNISMTMLNKLFFLDKKFSTLDFRIESLEIKNFKQYKAPFVIEFSKQVNIIVGKNAIGKTTLLQAITLGLLEENLWDARQLKYNKYITKNENEAEIVIGHNGSKKVVKIKKDDREIDNNYFIPFILAYGSNFFTKYDLSVDKIVEDILNETINEKIAYSIFEDYVDEFWNPLKILSNLDKSSHDKAKNKKDIIFDTINKFLEEYSLVKDEDSSAYFFQKENDKTKLSLDELSEGYRGNVLLITDILIKVLGVGYEPKMGDEENEKNWIEGIILIDEFDKHLHPRWQSKLVSKLTEVFPKIQFIMTTHNPMSILDREADEITMIKEIDGKIVAERGKGTKSIDVSIVLLEYFGVNSLVGQDMQDKVEKFFELKEKRDNHKKFTDEDKNKFKSIENELDGTMASRFIYDKSYFNFLTFIKENDNIDFSGLKKLNKNEFKSLLDKYKAQF